MTRTLKTSGFLGLTAMMTIGIYQLTLMPDGGAPGWLVGAHAHLGVLSIIAIVLGFVVDAFDLTKSLRSVVTGSFVAGQWGLPGTIIVAYALALPPLNLLNYLWGALLVLSMAIMTWQAATFSPVSASEPTQSAPADD